MFLRRFCAGDLDLDLLLGGGLRDLEQIDGLTDNLSYLIWAGILSKTLKRQVQQPRITKGSQIPGVLG